MSESPSFTVDDDDGKEQERLTSKEFVDLIPHLPFPQILQVEVRIFNEWKFLVSKINCTIGNIYKNQNASMKEQKNYFCTLCKIPQSSQTNMVAHINGVKHAVQMQAVEDIYHPEYTCPKSTENKQKNGNSKNLPVKKPINPKQNSPQKAGGSQQKNDGKTANSSLNLVLNPLSVKRPNDSGKENKTNTAGSPEIPENPELNEIPEIIIIDDNDDEQEQQTATNKRLAEENSQGEDSAKKKPKIMVSSFARYVEDSSNNNASKKVDNATTNEDKTKVDDEYEDQKFKIHGFIGVEYVVKINANNIASRYECGLCELNLGFDDMQKHLLGYSHRLKFCEKHFPTAIQQFRQYIVDVPSEEHYKVMIPVLQKLAEAIEKHHGRSKPFDCLQKRFKEERIRVLTQVFARAHASEQDGPTFTHVIDSRDVDKYISNRNEFIHQEKIVKVPIFDNIKPTANATIPVVNPKPKVQDDTAPIVKIANQMHTHFQMSQPYHFEGSFSGLPYIEPQPYMGQQPYMHPSQPYMPPPQPFVQQQCFMGSPAMEPLVDDETHKRMVDKFLKANSKDGHSNSSRRHDRHDRHDRQDSRDRYDRHDRNTHHRDAPRTSRYSRTPPRLLDSNSAPSKDNHSKAFHNIWNTYCRLVDHKVEALNENFKQYKSNPESHPSYNEEWLKFWQRRKAELVATGKDYRTYNYQPDWVAFFNNRIKELYDESFELLKIQSREELSLPLTNNEHVLNTKYHIHDKSMENKEMEKSMENFEPPIKAQKISPAEMEIPSSSYSRIDDDETPTIVSVLRLLTALEEHLGSLGPKIVDLLTKALQAEKAGPAQGLALINEENCSLLETAMEKFKGVIIARIVDNAKERALKRAVAKVTAFLEIAKKTRELVAKRPAFNLGPVDDTTKKTHVIEEKLVAVLAAQGHTHFDRDKLEQLATVCALLDKKKREVENSAPSTRSQPPAQKPLSDALSDIMDNFGSTSFPTRKPSTSSTTNLSAGRSTTSTIVQYPTSSLSSSTYANSTNTNRNFGNTYSGNASNFEVQLNRNMNSGQPATGWERQQQQLKLQQQQQPQQFRSQQQNMASYEWNQSSNRGWANNQQRASNYSGQPNRPPKHQGPQYM